ncbi:serine hydrolase domain-containing protein [Clavibacter zhangzhiyongii]|uniref:serine hydrolase domain-containing protein n=1 Tax=Clavibacter zhangzhiyongii TaxID=2768071 RepID=UPI0039E0B1FD
MSTAADALARLVEGIDRERLGAYGAVVRIGDDEAAHRWRSDDRENLYSVSKGVCALAVGIAVDEGILSLDSRVPELLPDLELGPGVETVTVEHLLTMTSGIDFAWFGDEPVPGPDLAQAMLGLPSRGRVFQYSDASPYVVMRMLAAAVGDVRDWLLPRLFAAARHREPAVAPLPARLRRGRQRPGAPHGRARADRPAAPRPRRRGRAASS